MAFQFINYAGIPAQGNPALRNLAQSLMQGYQAARLPTQIGQEEQGRALANQLKQLELQYKPQDIQTSLALRRAQMENAQTQAQANRMNLERMKKFQELIAAQTSGADSQDAIPESSTPTKVPYKLPEEGMQSALQDSNDIPTGQYGSPLPPPTAGEKQQRVVVNQGNPQLHKLDELYMQHPEYRDQFEKLGFKLSRQIKQSPETGQVFSEITYPSGRVEVQSIDVGKSPMQVEREKSFGKTEGKIYDNALDAVQTAQGALDNLDYINDILKDNPAFKDVVGPVNNILAKWTGRPEDKELLGNLNTAVGNIVLDAAKSIKGAFTGRDLGLINSVKPNVNDFSDVFRGKLNAMRLLAETVSKRNRLIANYMRQGSDPENAIQRARKETNFDDIRKEIGELSNPTTKNQLLQNELKARSFNTRDEFLKFLSQLPSSQREALKRQLIRGR